MARRLLLAALFPALLLPLSCTQFFTTSLAPWAARDPSDLIPAVKASNVADLVAMAAGDPAMSLEVLKGIESAVAKASEADKPALQAAALEAAANASGVGPAILNTAGDVVSSLDGEDPDAVKSVIVGAVAGLGQLAQTSASLTALLPDPADTAAFDAFVAAASPDDLASAAVVLLAAEAKASGDVSGYLDTFDPAAPASPAGELAVALATAAAENYTGTGPLADLLSALGLTTP